MLKRWLVNSLLAFCIVTIFFLVRGLYQIAGGRQESEELLSTVEERLNENVSLANHINGKYIKFDSDQVLDSEFNRRAETLLNDHCYFFYFDNQMCEPCISGAFKLLSLIPDRINSTNFICAGMFPSPREIIVRVRSENIRPSAILHLSIPPISMDNLAQYPIILKVNGDGLILNSCYVTSDMPVSYYNTFLTK